MRLVEARRLGFSLIELMIALAIVAIVTSQVLGMLSTQAKTYANQSQVLDIQEDARLVAELVLQDIRMAGFMVPPRVGISSSDGSNTAADVICASDPNIISDSALDAAMDRFRGAAVSAAVSGGDNGVEVVAADMDIDGDGDDDFAVDAGIIISEGTNSHCARIISIAGNNITFTPRTPTGFSVTSIDGLAVPAVTYEIPISGSGLYRNNQLISSRVEDVQIEFGVDADNDGLLDAGEFPRHGLNGSDPSDVLWVRLSVTTRTGREDTELTSNGFQAVGNRNSAAIPDRFMRRQVVVVAAPRNLL